MTDSMEVQIAEIRKDVAYLKEKADAIAENQKEIFKAIEEFHTFKGQIKVWGTVAIVGITFLKDAVIKMLSPR